MTAPSPARKTFTVSPLAEFASTAELAKATRHPVARWPLVIAKELIDNVLDAAEEAKVAPPPGPKLLALADFNQCCAGK